ncbi:hypothetical protein AAG570_013811 [Ranatra chinensis]|uniref:Uncharacterized protein n=1 Tax=Ranatra chinensis TaxID=642074 RepID=A0ABD0YPV7_9HEMI
MPGGANSRRVLRQHRVHLFASAVGSRRVCKNRLHVFRAGWEHPSRPPISAALGVVRRRTLAGSRGGERSLKKLGLRPLNLNRFCRAAMVSYGVADETPVSRELDHTFADGETPKLVWIHEFNFCCAKIPYIISGNVFALVWETPRPTLALNSLDRASSTAWVVVHVTRVEDGD